MYGEAVQAFGPDEPRAVGGEVMSPQLLLDVNWFARDAVARARALESQAKAGDGAGEQRNALR